MQKTVQQWVQNAKRAVDPFSLQLRLTLGITLVSLLGVGSVATWTAWRTQQILIESHKEWIADVAARIPQDIELYHKMLPLPDAIDKAIEVRSLPGLLIAVQDAQGNVIASSSRLNQDSVLTAIAPDPETYPDAELYSEAGQHYVTCAGPLVVDNVPVGYLYIAQDVTDDQEMFLALMRTISVGTLLVCVLMPGAIALYVKRSLRPLCDIGQLSESLDVQDLGNVQLKLDAAPTEILELARSYEGMLMRLSDAWNQQRQFVSDVSHELRTPLTIVSGYLNSTLRRCQTLTDPQREALTIASAEAERTIQILEDMLALARAESGYIRFELEPISLNDLAYDVASMVERSKQRPVLVDAAAADITVRADRHRLKQVLLNLVENGLKYSPEDAPVWIGLAQTLDQATVQVRDRGCGIPPQHQSRIFDRFYRVDETRTRATGGCGLGLAIAKTLVEGMKGTITVDSIPGEGTTFTITLPTTSVNHDTTPYPSR